MAGEFGSHFEDIHPLLNDGYRVAKKLLPFSPNEAKLVEELMIKGFSPDTIPHINNAISGVTARVDGKLATVAMNSMDYFNAYKAFHAEDHELHTSNLITQTERKLNLDSVVTTASSLTPEGVETKNKAIIDEILSSVPVVGRRKQKFIGVGGPFAAGKSETVRERFNFNDALQLDLDILRQMLMKGYDPENQKDIQTVREESWILSDIVVMRALQSGRSVVIQSAFHREDRWLYDPNFAYASRTGIDLEFFMVLRPIADCLIRNVKRNGRTVRFKDLVESVNGMSVLPKLAEKFGNTRSVTLIDYYPFIEADSGECRYGKKIYRQLLEYAKSRNFAKVETQHFDIPTLDG